MDIFFYIDYTGHGWGLAMTGANQDPSKLNVELPGTRTIVAPVGTLTAREGHAIADAWTKGETVTLPEGAVLHDGGPR